MCLAVPVKILEILSPGRVRAETGGTVLELCSTLIENLSPGDYVLAHAGYIIQKITPQDAQEMLELYAEYREILSSQEN